MLKKENRISNPLLISKLHRAGSLYKTRTFVFKFLAANQDHSAFVVSISKKISNKAVKRNRLKRQILESVQSLMGSLKHPFVILIIQKNGTPDTLKYETIKKEITEFFNYLDQKNV